MTGLFKWWPRWEYVGTVTAHSQTVDEKGNAIFGGKSVGFWVLTRHRWWGRRTKYGGDVGRSEFARETRKAVNALAAGGPLPSLDEDTKNRTPAPVIQLAVDNSKGSK